MHIKTTRFGVLDVSATDKIEFPSGLLGLEDCHQWVLLADAGNPALAWLQSLTRADIALAVVSPRRFVPGYKARVSKSEISELKLQDVRDAELLAVVGKNGDDTTLNLKAPLIINLEARLGRQVIVNGDEPVQYVLHQPQPLRRAA